MNYELLRNASVEVHGGRDDGDRPVAIAEIAGKHAFTFPSTSRISKALEIMTPDALSERLSGGNYFFVEDQLIDFRDGHYNGFVHTDESIRHLADVVGITHRIGSARSTRVHENTFSSDWILGKKWSDHNIIVPAYKTGGEFTSELHFGWNPFVKTVNSAFMLYRLVCENGMRGLTTFLNSKIPLINRWTEHLDIANRQIQNKVEGMVTRRLNQMGRERATVAELMQISNHANTRLIKGTMMHEQRERLRRIVDIANPMSHLSGVYHQNVFTDKRLAAQMPAHLTTFDAYNLATEVRTHSPEADGSSTIALDRISNHLVFDHKDTTAHVSRFALPKQSSFSDPDAAFFGEMH